MKLVQLSRQPSLVRRLFACGRRWRWQTGEATGDSVLAHLSD
jgi:hypothetical protein